MIGCLSESMPPVTMAALEQPVLVCEVRHMLETVDFSHAMTAAGLPTIVRPFFG